MNAPKREPDQVLASCQVLLRGCWDSGPDIGAVDPDAPLIELGIDSLTFVALLDSIHHEFGITWDAEDPPAATSSLRSLAQRVIAVGDGPTGSGGTIAGPMMPSRPLDGREHAAVDDFRSLMSYFPTGVAVVTSTADDSTPHGATCSSLSSVTLTPPTLLVCLRSASRTLVAVRGRQQFAVNLLHARARSTAELFASSVADRFARVDWRLSPVAKLPWLAADALAVAECTVSGLVCVGDHTVVLGRVIGIEALPDAPLMYGLRQFSAWTAGTGAR